MPPKPDKRAALYPVGTPAGSSLLLRRAYNAAASGLLVSCLA
jgi:hypothetical protein